MIVGFNKERALPNRPDNQAMSQVEFRIASVLARIQEVQEADIKIVGRFTERRTQIVNCMGPRVITGEAEAGLRQVVGLHSQLQRIIDGKSAISAQRNGCIPPVQSAERIQRRIVTCIHHSRA